jgi:hypothetical protein
MDRLALQAIRAEYAAMAMHREASDLRVLLDQGRWWLAGWTAGLRRDYRTVSVRAGRVLSPSADEDVAFNAWHDRVKEQLPTHFTAYGSLLVRRDDLPVDVAVSQIDPPQNEPPREKPPLSSLRTPEGIARYNDFVAAEDAAATAATAKAKSLPLPPLVLERRGTRFSILVGRHFWRFLADQQFVLCYVQNSGNVMRFEDGEITSPCIASAALCNDLLNVAPSGDAPPETEAPVEESQTPDTGESVAAQPSSTTQK